jgi:hypothetical protein
MDVYSFGATMYRLLTGKKLQHEELPLSEKPAGECKHESAAAWRVLVDTTNTEPGKSNLRMHSAVQ